MRKASTLLARIGVLALAAVLFTGTFSGAAGQAAGHDPPDQAELDH